MRNVLLVIRHEIARTIGKPSFWISAFVFPMLIFAFTFGSQLMARGMTDGDDEAEFLDLVTGASAPNEQKPMGYVDLAGVIKSLPDGLPVAVLEPYPSLEAADMAVEAGAIDEYYVLPEEFADSREIVLVQRSYSPFEPLEGGNLFEYVVTYNLTGDPDVAVLLQNPLSSVVLERSTPAQETPSAVGKVGQSLAPMAMLFIFFFVLTMSSGYVLTSVTKEKESRVVEVLLSSLNPRELMLGKLIGLSAVALLQMAIWLCGSLLVLREGSPIFGMASALLATTLPQGFILWALLYFLLGYVMFASALAAIGTLAPTAREGSQFTFIVLLPLMIPLWLNSAFVEAPRGALVTFLSMFPLTAPVSMVARMVGTTVPVWQILVSLALLVVTTYGLVVLSARLFRADTLLSGDPISLQRLRDGLRRRAV